MGHDDLRSDLGARLGDAVVVAEVAGRRLNRSRRCGRRFAPTPAGSLPRPALPFARRRVPPGGVAASAPTGPGSGDEQGPRRWFRSRPCIRTSTGVPPRYSPRECERCTNSLAARGGDGSSLMIGKDRCVASVLHCMNPCCQTSDVKFGESFGGSLVERFSVGPNDLLVLADGARFRLRPIGSEDRDGVAALFARLSPESRDRRFLPEARI
jgi:hypothetical protein